MFLIWTQLDFPTCFSPKRLTWFFLPRSQTRTVWPCWSLLSQMIDFLPCNGIFMKHIDISGKSSSLDMFRYSNSTSLNPTCFDFQIKYPSIVVYKKCTVFPINFGISLSTSRLDFWLAESGKSGINYDNFGKSCSFFPNATAFISSINV